MNHEQPVMSADWAIRSFAYHPKPLSDMNESLARLHSVWNEKREDRLFPRKDAIKPRDIKEYLAFAAMLRVIDGGADFEYRLVGHVLNHAFGGNLQGRLASQVYALGKLTDLNDLMNVVFRPVVSTGTPRLVEFVSEYPDRSTHHREALHLPLGDDAVDHILVASSAP